MLKTSKIYYASRIFGYPEECGFGDIWAVTSYLLRLSEKTSTPTKFFTKSQRFKTTMKEILPFLNSSGRIEFVAGSAAHKILNYCEPYRTKFVPTTKIWERRHSKIIAYQFDGNHLAKLKNISSFSVSKLLDSLTKMGYTPVNIGDQKSIEFIVDTLSQAKLFVGCPSGLSIAAISVGTPIFLITKMLNVDFVRFLRSCQYHTTCVKIFRTIRQFLLCLNRDRQPTVL